MSSKSIVIIDDNPEGIAFLEGVVKEHASDYTCVSYSHPVDAVATLVKGPADVPSFIFIELNMSTMRGDECVTAIRREKSLRKVPIAVLSGTMHDQTKERLLNGGANFALKTPIPADEIGEVLEEALAS